MDTPGMHTFSRNLGPTSKF